MCSDSTEPAVAAKAATKIRKTHSPLFVNVPGVISGLPPQSSVPSTPPQQGSVHAASASKREKATEKHVCPHCGFERVRKSDMDDHLATYHGEGTPRTCNICGKT